MLVVANPKPQWPILLNQHNRRAHGLEDGWITSRLSMSYNSFCTSFLRKEGTLQAGWQIGGWLPMSVACFSLPTDPSSSSLQEKTRAYVGVQELIQLIFLWLTQLYSTLLHPLPQHLLLLLTFWGCHTYRFFKHCHDCCNIQLLYHCYSCRLPPQLGVGSCSGQAHKLSFLLLPVPPLAPATSTSKSYSCNPASSHTPSPNTYLDSAMTSTLLMAETWMDSCRATNDFVNWLLFTPALQVPWGEAFSAQCQPNIDGSPRN